MLLYLVRHGDYEISAPTEEARVLSATGITITTCMARLLARAQFESPEIIIASPIIRARQTARILAEEFAPNARIEISEALLSGSELERAMSLVASKRGECRVLMLVGHDPLFSHLASVLVTGAESPAIEMQKSAVALFELTRFDVPRMRGVLRAYLPPVLA
ncbi:MAG: histidine phosphatase family protein [Bacteroidota bacterium]|nr:histidine phosphatase family protein [Bacteroidota bacterium]MDP4233709.1 histidine phosphatase family protein [Bacteroidota bacterium]MDP4242348.1 histidine phosphatase family protein [Bacteroidota bacterium]MDP4288699.1 histidine phosphatase family protein [Bacteroidota bacterium]